MTVNTIKEDAAADSIRVYFKQSKHDLDLNLNGNGRELNRIEDKFKSLYADTLYTITKIEVLGAASPEGSVSFNQGLSERRANTLFNYLSKYTDIPDSLKIFKFLGRDWAGLRKMAASDNKIPYKDETVALIDEIILEIEKDSVARENSVARLKKLRKGVPYRYMYSNLFPDLRASQLVVWYEKRLNPILVQFETELMTEAEMPAPEDSVILDIPYTIPEEEPKKPFYMALKSNMLYDVAAVPNIGAEFYLGKRLSVGLNWMYAWWNTDRRHRYWRTYGGDVYLRYWIGKKAAAKPLTGHHIGVYAQTLTYDFEWGGKGYIGGEPGGTLWDRAHWGGGLEYGYSLPIGKRLNIDMTLGVGYLGGRYYEYYPENGEYVWQATKNRHWFGPTKLEVSLVWLLGRGNSNKKKGGEL